MSLKIPAFPSRVRDVTEGFRKASNTVIELVKNAGLVLATTDDQTAGALGDKLKPGTGISFTTATSTITIANSGVVTTGSVIAWPTESAPAGFLECNGAAKSNTTYSALYAVIGNTFGTGTATATFKLPDLRGEFIRGWDHGAGNDPDSSTRTDRGDGTTSDHVGTWQSGAFASHRHGTYAYHDPVRFSGGVGYSPSGQGSYWTTYDGGKENRPRNMNFMYIIKT